MMITLESIMKYLYIVSEPKKSMIWNHEKILSKSMWSYIEIVNDLGRPRYNKILWKNDM